MPVRSRHRSLCIQQRKTPNSDIPRVRYFEACTLKVDLRKKTRRTCLKKRGENPPVEGTAPMMRDGRVNVDRSPVYQAGGSGPPDRSFMGDADTELVTRAKK